MRLTVLHVPDCALLAPLLHRIGQVTDAPVVTRLVDTDAEASSWGMHGSPTLLVDGADPFDAPALAPGLWCRLYRDEHGNPTSVPSVSQLRRVLSRQHGS